MVAGCYLAGVSTRRMDKLVKTLGIDPLSRSQVSRMATDLDEHVGQFRHRPLGPAGPFTFVAADALTMKVREDGHVVNAVVLVAVGVKLWSKNPAERLNREVRCRTDAVGIFPTCEATVRLVGAVLAEQTDESAGGRRYLGLGGPRTLSLDPHHHPRPRHRSRAHARPDRLTPNEDRAALHHHGGPGPGAACQSERQNRSKHTINRDHWRRNWVPSRRRGS